MMLFGSPSTGSLAGGLDGGMRLIGGSGSTCVSVRGRLSSPGGRRMGGLLGGSGKVLSLSRCNSESSFVRNGYDLRGLSTGGEVVARGGVTRGEVAGGVVTCGVGSGVESGSRWSWLGDKAGCCVGEGGVGSGAGFGARCGAGDVGVTGGATLGVVCGVRGGALPGGRSSVSSGPSGNPL